MLASDDLARQAQGDDRPNAAALTLVVDRAGVVALVHGAGGRTEAVGSHGVEQRGHDRNLSVLRRVGLPRDGKARRGADGGVHLYP